MHPAPGGKAKRFVYFPAFYEGATFAWHASCMLGPQSSLFDYVSVTTYLTQAMQWHHFSGDSHMGRGADVRGVQA